MFYKIQIKCSAPAVLSPFIHGTHDHDQKIIADQMVVICVDTSKAPRNVGDILINSTYSIGTNAENFK